VGGGVGEGKVEVEAWGCTEEERAVFSWATEEAEEVVGFETRPFRGILK